MKKWPPKGDFYRDYLEISASASRHHHRHWSWLWHWHCKKIIFTSRNFFLKKEHLCSFFCLVLASVPLCYKYLFFYDTLFIYPKAFISVLEKDFLNFRRHLSIVFWKTNYFEYFCKLPSKMSRTEQLFCREPVNACFCKKELHSTCYLRSFPEF